MNSKSWRMKMAFMAFFVAGWHIPARPGVIITGLLHGTLTGGSPKAIELFISGTEDLNNYEVWRSLNGAPFGSGSGSISSMTGVYSNTFVYLVKSDQVAAFHAVFGNEGIYTNVLPMGIISGNGNDGFQVRLKAGSVVMDQVWFENAEYSYRDSYWYRKHGTGPDGGWLETAWETPGNDALDGMDEAGLRAAVPFGTYAVVWTGVTSNWNDAGNWTSGIFPSFQTNVLIPGSAPIYPHIDNLPENPAVCMNLTVADTASLIVNAGKALTVHGNLSLENQAGGESDEGLILKSDNDLVPAGSLLLSGTASGTASIERRITKDNHWHFISSPVQEQAFQPEFIPDPPDQSFDLYYWEENASPAAGWINSRDENGEWNPQFGDAFIQGKGYLIAYSESNTGDITRKFIGLLNSGDFTFTLCHSGNFWNLLGNPYSCAIDWSSAGIDKTAVAGGTMYIWDPALNGGLGGYRAHNGTEGIPTGTTPYIPSTQAFYVQSSMVGNLSIDISDDNPRVHAEQPVYKNADDMDLNKLRLKISNHHCSDETLIYFDPVASNFFDPAFDADKLFNGHSSCPEIFSMAEGHSLCINMLNRFPVSVPVGVSYNQEDTLDLMAFDFEGIPEETGIFLEDTDEGKLIDLREQPEYHFYNDPALPVTRFILHFMDSAGLAGDSQDQLIKFGSSKNGIFIINPENIRGTIFLYSIEGRLIKTFETTGANQIIQPGVSTGIYVLIFDSPDSHFKCKMFIY